ncbi:hypothetical protein [Paenibacillus nasutitermitis]|uniref:Uncharacterized protein n=1 Tax=Paenibacillus nasutitermitis TaxID=1652958 RepID=A0A916YNM5_9BACL|nr:hypothetical protein [Paenibacillus nasutitermitis]GGD53949.1 hypothetical protein GCM10010911_09330 [Paenibacillus nasutitermitis]
MLKLKMENNTPKLVGAGSALSFSERPYQYEIISRLEKGTIHQETIAALVENQDGGMTICSGSFPDSGLVLEQSFQYVEDGVSETLTLSNPNPSPVHIDQVRFGFTALLNDRESWRLCAIPFKVQLDGSKHDYTVDELIAGKGKNAAYVDASREEPSFTEEGLRSEAWAWGDASGGLVIIKYNNEQIEYSMARVDSVVEGKEEKVLRFGGAGLALYGEPSGTRVLEPGESFKFGQTFYYLYEGEIGQAYKRYRSFLKDRGHTFPQDYNPPVNWNVLYDIGWHHSDADQLREHYHRDAVLQEAAKAQDCGCELLYLDPGWEVAEGLTLWDESRLGDVNGLVVQLKEEYGLDLGYRTILRAYKPHWKEEYMVRHSYGLMQPEKMEPVWGYHFEEPCLCNPAYFEVKLKRILAITSQGIRFMMFDEMDWRGPCYDPSHGHPVPSTPLHHIEAVYRLAEAVRNHCPVVLTEVHDPVWPWSNALYAPTYFRQGAQGIGSYNENWGFEYMWNCIEDLKTGKALALYYYNLGCSIPLYLHITMAADNDACVFFWWTASTVRHLGIGGKTSHPTVEFAGELAPYDKEQRYEGYKNQMALYQRLKAYFVRGTFHGLAEHIHLHTLEGQEGGVINVFNLADEELELVFTVPANLLGSQGNLKVVGAEGQWQEASAEFRLVLGPMSPGVVAVGEAAELIE